MRLVRALASALALTVACAAAGAAVCEPATGAPATEAPVVSPTLPVIPPAPVKVPNRQMVTLPSNQYLQTSTTSWAELRFRGIVRQTLDLSCGAVALATLLHGYFGLDADESTVIRGMLENASPEDVKKISTYGFSLLELKKYAESRGLIAGGFKSANAAELRKLRAPVIALTNSRGYNHFVVLRHVRGDEVAIADPVFGNRTMTLTDFAKRWNNVILVAVAPGRRTNAAFLEAPKGAIDPRAVQLYLSRFYSPVRSYAPGDFF